MASKAEYFESLPESSSEEDDITEQPPRKCRRLTRTWREIEKFPLATEAEHTVNSNDWKKCSSTVTENEAPGPI